MITVKDLLATIDENFKKQEIQDKALAEKIKKLSKKSYTIANAYPQFPPEKPVTADAHPTYITTSILPMVMSLVVFSDSEVSQNPGSRINPENSKFQEYHHQEPFDRRLQSKIA